MSPEGPVPRCRAAGRRRGRFFPACAGLEWARMPTWSAAPARP